jgi:hypothetical protein
MKFNPYAALLMTGALMVITVALFQTGSSAALLRAGAVSVDKDVSSFASKTWTSLEARAPVAQQRQADQPRETPTRVASIDRQQPRGGPSAD